MLSSPTQGVSRQNRMQRYIFFANYEKNEAEGKFLAPFCARMAQPSSLV